MSSLHSYTSLIFNTIQIHLKFKQNALPVLCLCLRLCDVMRAMVVMMMMMAAKYDISWVLYDRYVIIIDNWRIEDYEYMKRFDMFKKVSFVLILSDTKNNLRRHTLDLLMSHSIFLVRHIIGRIRVETSWTRNKFLEKKNLLNQNKNQKGPVIVWAVFWKTLTHNTKSESFLFSSYTHIHMWVRVSEWVRTEG